MASLCLPAHAGRRAACRTESGVEGSFSCVILYVSTYNNTKYSVLAKYTNFTSVKTEEKETDNEHH
jgi:hypothetical protein